VLAGRYLLNPLFRVLSNAGAREVMTAAALMVIIAAAVLMTYVGLSAALGAFLAGVMLAESSYRHELEADIEPFRGLLLGLFFISVGMTVDLRVVAEHWKLLAGALVTLTLIKVSVVYGLLRLLRNPHEVAIRTALHLPQGGEFGFVLFATGVAAGVMPAIQGTLLVALVTLSMALTPMLVALAPHFARSRTGAPDRDVDFDGASGSVLMIGFGRFGQLVCQLLLPEGVDVTIIDNDVEMLDAAGRFGFKLYYGDGTRLDVLRAAGAERARMICVCVERKEQANRIVLLCTQAFPLARLHVRAFDRVHALELIELGAHYQIRETFESAIAFGRDALQELGVRPERIAEVESDIRQRDRERFAMQQQGSDWVTAGRESLYVRPVPRPEPLINPRRQAVDLNPHEREAPPTPGRTEPTDSA
jgi:voltage-gated potassium channel Kch